MKNPCNFYECEEEYLLHHEIIKSNQTSMIVQCANKIKLNFLKPVSQSSNDNNIPHVYV